METVMENQFPLKKKIIILTNLWWIKTVASGISTSEIPCNSSSLEIHSNVFVHNSDNCSVANSTFLWNFQATEEFEDFCVGVQYGLTNQVKMF